MIVHKVIVNYIPQSCVECPIKNSIFSGVSKIHECGKTKYESTGSYLEYKVPDDRCLLEKLI